MPARTPCYEVDPRFPTFCASLANGRKRCKKGTCWLVDNEPEQEGRLF